MAAPCCIHYRDGGINDENPANFSSDRWKTTCTSAEKWKDLDGEDKAIAVRLLTAGTVFKVGERQYHNACYLKFNSKRRIDQAIARVSKQKQSHESKPHTLFVSPTTSTTRPSKLRSKTKSPASSVTVRRRNEHVLPERCIICKRTKYCMNRSSGVKAPEKLMQFLALPWFESTVTQVSDQLANLRMQ